MQLYNGDCLEVMKSIPNKSIDLILCDLPYGITKCKWDTPIDLFAMWNQYNRIIKDNAPILLFAQTPFDKVLGSSNLSMLKYEWIWEKAQATGHLNAKKMPMKDMKIFLCFIKNCQFIIHKKQLVINPFIHILNILKLKTIQNYMDI